MTFSPTTTDTVLDMLTYKRPDGSPAESAFIERFVRPHATFEDDFGNLYAEVGDAPAILFSSHTDTVHLTEGRQSIEVTEDGWVYTAIGAQECLGADCTAGVWLMIEMIKAGVPGLYIFHRAEEVGGRGSSYIARHQPKLLAGIQAAIAFDRKGFTSIITHQFGGRCCSDAFAASVATTIGGEWHLDDGGTFTDTANYTDLIPECTNLSVGYLDQHSSRECLNIRFLDQLLANLIQADWSRIVIQRKPGELDQDDWPIRKPSRSYHLYSERELMIQSVQDNPDMVADLLLNLGYSPDDIEQMYCEAF